MPFTLPMLVARLVLGALSSIVAGAACAWVARSGTRTSWVLGIVLIVIFVPIHVWLWQIFPPWYHLAFLISLLPCTLLGAGFAPRTDCPPAELRFNVRRNLEYILDLMASETLRLDSLITHRLQASRMKEAYELASQHSTEMIGTVFQWS